MSIPVPETRRTPAPLHGDLLQGIRERRSIGKCTDEVPDPALIRQVLEAGTWAPNHHFTQPWRFVVLSGDARIGLGEAMGKAAARQAASPEAGDAARERALKKALRAPYIIALYADPDPTALEIEEIASTAAAGQNVLLAAHAFGLAAMWRSGELIYTPEVRQFFQLPEKAIMLGVIYVGYPAMGPPQRDRRPIDEVAVWWDAARPR